MNYNTQKITRLNQYNYNNISEFEFFNNLEKCFSIIKHARTKSDSPCIFSHSNDSGNGITNSIAAYSGLVSVFNLPNDSSRSLPEQFFTVNHKIYKRLMTNLLLSKIFYKEFAEKQKEALKAYIKSFDLNSQARKLLL